MSRQSMERAKQIEDLTAANRAMMGECQRLQVENRRLRNALTDFAACLHAYAEDPSNAATWSMLEMLCARAFESGYEAIPNPAAAQAGLLRVLAEIAVAWRDCQESHKAFAIQHQDDQEETTRCAEHRAQSGTYGLCAAKLEAQIKVWEAGENGTE